MNARILRASVVAALGVSLVQPVHAKGPTVRLVVTGASLVEPLDVTDPEVLGRSGVYGGTFLGDLVAEPDRSLSRYRVFFHVELPKWLNAGVQVKYVVTYVTDPRTGTSFVYLPGRGEDGYWLNVRTIIRDGRDGAWHKASDQWAAALGRHLP